MSPPGFRVRKLTLVRVPAASLPSLAGCAGLIAACAGLPACGGAGRASAPAPVQLSAGQPGPELSVDLAGSWKYLPYNGEGDMAATVIDDAKWPSMTLPSNWFLLGRKEYPPQATAVPPSFGDNAPGELWPVNPRTGLDYSGTVWFRRTLEIPPGAHGPVVLDLDMVDYYAEVFVNGAPVGRHEGYFQRWSVDATNALRPGTNVIAVKVSAPALDFDMAQQYPVSWPKMQNQVKGIFAYHDTRPGATSWRGQERSTGGILRGIALRESSGVDLTNVTVTPLDVSAASARLVIDATVHNWTSKEEAVDLDGQIHGASFEDPHALAVHTTAHAPPGISHVRVETKIDHPHLWWPRDYGKPELYAIDATLSGGGKTRLDARTARFGVRSVRLDDKWTFWLNGQRIYPRGTNYIATQWLSQADRAFYARDLQAMVDANLNSIRVHAHLERQEMYDLADELGLMVWQDFPLQWGYTDMPAFREEALRQAEDMVREYGDHPSVIVWCMHNESPHAMSWMKLKDPGQNLALDDSLAALARKLDPSRVVRVRAPGRGDAADDVRRGEPLARHAERLGDLAVCRFPAEKRVRPREGEPGAEPRRVRQEHAALPGHFGPLHDRGLPPAEVGSEHRDLPVHVRRRLAVDHLVGRRLLPAPEARLRRAQAVDAAPAPEHRVLASRSARAGHALRGERFHEAVRARDGEMDDHPAGEARRARGASRRHPERRRHQSDGARQRSRAQRSARQARRVDRERGGRSARALDAGA
jgi:hypothetical protein